MQVQAAEAEAAAGQGGLDQLGFAMAAEAHLGHQPFAEGPLQQLGARPVQRPLQVLSKVEAMHRQVGELGNAQALEDRPQLLLAVGEIAAGQHLAGDSPAAWGSQVVPLQGR